MAGFWRQTPNSARIRWEAIGLTLFSTGRVNMSDSSRQDRNPGATDAKLVELIKLGCSAMQNRDYGVADQAGSALLDRAWEMVVEAAERDEVDDNLLLKIEAADCEDRGDWDGAISAYQKILEIAVASSSPFAIWKARDDLAGLYFLLGDHDSAIREQHLATAAMRRDDSELEMRMALISEATLLLRIDRFSDAFSRVAEGLAIQDTTVDDKLGRTRLMVLNASCLAAAGHLDDARAVLRDSWPYLNEASQMAEAGGVHATVCSWWWAEADCSESSKDLPGNVHALRQALAAAPYVAQLSHCDSVYTKAKVVRVREQLAESLSQCGQLDEARSLRKESQSARVALKLLPLPRIG
jgi:tetratricopeptide (TPR) repeat protein